MKGKQGRDRRGAGGEAHLAALAAAPEIGREEGTRNEMDHKEGLVPGTIKGTVEPSRAL
jgi:hypothetical protein